jgi:hypothetical protein
MLIIYLFTLSVVLLQTSLELKSKLLSVVEKRVCVVALLKFVLSVMKQFSGSNLQDTTHEIERLW